MFARFPQNTNYRDNRQAQLACAIRATSDLGMFFNPSMSFRAPERHTLAEQRTVETPPQPVRRSGCHAGCT